MALRSYVRRRVNPAFPELMKQIGILPPDTDFNRRAAAYAHWAENLERSNERNRRRREARQHEDF